nr:PTS transporter subunit EIIC [Enterococcus faecium]
MLAVVSNDYWIFDFHSYWNYRHLTFLIGPIFGGTYSLIVMTGLHQSFPAIETQLLSAWTNGIGHGDFIFVVASMANVAQGAATFAIWFLTKNSKTKSLASSAGVSSSNDAQAFEYFG